MNDAQRTKYLTEIALLAEQLEPFIDPTYLSVAERSSSLFAAIQQARGLGILPPALPQIELAGARHIAEARIVSDAVRDELDAEVARLRVDRHVSSAGSSLHAVLSTVVPPLDWWHVREPLSDRQSRHCRASERAVFVRVAAISLDAITEIDAQLGRDRPEPSSAGDTTR